MRSRSKAALVVVATSALLVATGCGCGDSEGSLDDAGAIDASDSEIDTGPPVTAAWDLVVADVPWPARGLDALGTDDLILMGPELVVIGRDGVEKQRRRLPDYPIIGGGRGLGDQFVMLRESNLGVPLVSRYDSALELIDERGSPSNGASQEVWAPGTTATWFLALDGLDEHVAVGKVPHDGPSEAWTFLDWPSWVMPMGGVTTVAGTPVFFAHCVIGVGTENPVGTGCALRADPVTGALTSVEVERGKVIQAAWLAESPLGVVVLYRRIDSKFGEEFAASYHAVLLDPAGPTILAGPNLLWNDSFGGGIQEAGLVVLGDRAYIGGGVLFSFDIATLAGWMLQQLPDLPDANYDEGSYGLAVVEGELYRHVGIRPNGGVQSVLVQKLVLPGP